MDVTTDSIYELLIKYIRMAIGKPEFNIVVAKQDVVELSGEYATILAYHDLSHGTGQAVEKYFPPVDEVPAVGDVPAIPAVEQFYKRAESALRSTAVSVQFHRGNAHEYARKVMGFASTERARILFETENVALQVPSSARTLDRFIGSGWKKISQIDLTLISSTEYVETVGVIEEATVQINQTEPEEIELEIKQ